jgi:CHASE2 domain-containing sensor protein
MIMMIVGLLLAVSSAYTAFVQAGWPRLLPSILIGLSLMAVGYSLVARARRSRSSRSGSSPSGSDGTDRDEL